ncbi:MAG: (2Fe-2S)-binding protein [Acidimicrobiia bacterium]|jgi:aerobic-type carbon monoxide dehydrogenase small subunit (CoxS/CutS family)
MSDAIRFTLNGKPVTLETNGDRSLLWALRTDLELTGTKYGCGAGFCGSCTVVVDGTAVRACLLDLNKVHGKDLTTIEGLADNGRLHPLQQAFFEQGGFQCGYCTPGMIMNAYGMLEKNPRPTRDEIIQGMENNLCRCSAYKRIIEAVEIASVQMGGTHE